MEEYVNISQTAKMLRVSRPLVYRLIEEGKLTPYRNPLYRGKGGPVLIPREQVEALAKPQP
jgi:excisionase family DNA binding protein